jgi:hypothetical protein
MPALPSADPAPGPQLCLLTPDSADAGAAMEAGRSFCGIPPVPQFRARPSPDSQCPSALREVQEAASHADPRTTMRYDRARGSLDRHATYIVAAYLAGAAR